MIILLPVELQQLIYDKLPAKDRAKLFMALPKPSRCALRTNRVRDKHLHAIAGGVQKKRVRRLSPKVKEFLLTCSENDPTLEPIKAEFPDEIAWPQDSTGKTETLTQEIIRKIKNNTLTVEDLAKFNASILEVDGTYPSIPDELARASPTMTAMVLENSPLLREHMLMNHAKRFAHDLVWSGESGLENWHWLESHAIELGIDLSSTKEYLKDISMASCSSWEYCIKNILAMVSFTKEELEDVWERCMDRLYVDAAYHVDKCLQQLP